MASDRALNFLTDLAQRTREMDAEQPHFGFDINGVLSSIGSFSGDPRRVLDIACGYGGMSLAVAKTFAEAQVDGIDFDELAVLAADKHARSAGVANRCKFHHLNILDARPPWMGRQHDVVLGLAAQGVFNELKAFYSFAAGCVAPGGWLFVDDTSLAVTPRQTSDRQHEILELLRGSGAITTECVKTAHAHYERSQSLERLDTLVGHALRGEGRPQLSRRMRRDRLIALRASVAATPARATIVSVLFAARYPAEQSLGS